jgi:hypothetical protein
MSYLTNCPPCDTNFPILCEPLETTANGKRLVVEDSAACQKTIQTPTGQQILKTDGSGNLSWTNGANDTVLTKSATGVVEFAPVSNQIPDGSITTDKLASAAVTNSKIQNLSVTAAKLGTNEQKQLCKAWVNFDGTGIIGSNQTIRSSYNVSSVTKNGTGSYVVNLTLPMADTNFTTSSSFRRITTWINSGSQALPITILSVSVQTVESNAASDSDNIFLQVFGN